MSGLFSKGVLQTSIYDLGKHFNVNFDGETVRDCIVILRELCPLLHTDEELQRYGETLLDKIYDKYGFLGVRVWFYISYKGIFHNSMMKMKYDKLYCEICELVEAHREECGLELILDMQLANFYLIQTFKERFGVFDTDYISEVYCILKTVHLTFYNPVVIEEVKEMLEVRLLMMGDNYYRNLDLSDEGVIKKIYTHFAEEMGDSDVYKGHQLFHDYDGYGESYFAL